MSNIFKTSDADEEDLVLKSKEVAKGKSLATAGIDGAWLTTYGEIARRCEDNKKFGLTHYPYEAGPSVSAFSGG